MFEAGSTSRDTLTARAGQTFKLPDGRLLGFAEYGLTTGTPIIWFHGYPGSRLEVSKLDEEATKRSIRLIAPDRPGFGLSSPHVGRSLLDYAADVRQLSKHLKLSRFALLGYSGGGPYALACVYTLPADMITAVGLQASSGLWEKGPIETLPLNVGPGTMPAGVRALLWACKSCPSVLTMCTNAFFSIASLVTPTRVFTAKFDTWIAKHEPPPEGVSIMTQRERLLKIFFEPHAQRRDAMVIEGLLLFQYWGFQPEDIRYDRILLWHGTKDKNVPISSARYLAALLPHALLKEFDADHYTLDKHVQEILDDMLEYISSHKISQDSS